MAGRVVVVGSLNMDLRVLCERVPERGETVIGSSLSFAPGGKGANQAVAAARLGASVAMAGRVGSDDFGRALRESLRASGVDVALVASGKAATGTALVVVDERGENRIVVVPGANGEVLLADAEPLLRDARGDLVLLQLEIPLATVRDVADAARRAGARVLLNAAPAASAARALAGLVDHLVVNESEAALLSGRAIGAPDAERAAVEALVAAGFEEVTLTRGERGALHRARDGWLEAAAPQVDVVDTTGAGDAFVGGLAAAWSRGADRRAALALAVAAGSLAVTREGAQPSLPRLAEAEALAAAIAVRSPAR